VCGVSPCLQGLRSMGKFLSSKAATLSNVLSGKMALPSDEAMVSGVHVFGLGIRGPGCCCAWLASKKPCLLGAHACSSVHTLPPSPHPPPGEPDSVEH
jgi:hypothetical protein